MTAKIIPLFQDIAPKEQQALASAKAAFEACLTEEDKAELDEFCRASQKTADQRLT